MSFDAPKLQIGNLIRIEGKIVEHLKERNAMRIQLGTMGQGDSFIMEAPHLLNYASLIGKAEPTCSLEFKELLEQYIKQHGNDGWVWTGEHKGFTSWLDSHVKKDK